MVPLHAASQEAEDRALGSKKQEIREDAAHDPMIAYKLLQDDLDRQQQDRERQQRDHEDERAVPPLHFLEPLRVMRLRRLALPLHQWRFLHYPLLFLLDLGCHRRQLDHDDPFEQD